MKLTKALRKWVIENCDIKEDAPDDDFRKAVADSLVKGTLTAEKHAELTKEADDEEAHQFTKSMESVTDKLDTVIDLFKKNLEKEPKEEPKNKEKETKAEEEETPTQTKQQPSRLAKMVAAIGGKIGDEEKSTDIRVKEAVESYSTTKSALMYPERTKRNAPHQMAGERVMSQGRPMDTASDQDKALAGVWAKFQLATVTSAVAGNAYNAWERLSEHEKSLLAHLVDEGEWDDSDDNRSRITKGYHGGLKALFDDATSGGIEAAPIVFDDQVIQAPLLHGELYPLVNEVPLARGRRVEGVSTLTVTGSWGGIDDTAISLFNTASYVAAFDTTIYRWEGSVQIGLDFMSDTPIDFGAHITTQYGQRLLEDLDDVIATGNGTTQPEGIMTASGTTSVAFGGTTSIGNYESLRFSVAKAEHGPVKNSAVFCGTETSYQRAHAIPVGAADARRLGGMEYDSYRWMQRPYKINESLTNAQIFYAIMARYRMYRRKGFTVRTSTEGDTLIRQNEMLIVVMSRYGGQIERGACAAVTTTAPA